MKSFAAPNSTFSFPLAIAISFLVSGCAGSSLSNKVVGISGPDQGRQSPSTHHKFTMFPLPGSPVAQYITRGPTNTATFWFTDQGNNSVGKITASGVVKEFPIPTPNSAPEGIALGPDGNMWFTEAGATTKIAKVTPRGHFTEYAYHNPNARPLDIVAGPDGNLWFTTSNVVLHSQSVIGRITTTGVITEYNILHPSWPTGAITVGPDGALWYVEHAEDSNIAYIGRITTTGDVSEYPINPDGLTRSAPSFIISGQNVLYFTDQSTNTISEIMTEGNITQLAFLACNGLDDIAFGSDGMIYVTTNCGLTPFDPLTNAVGQPAMPPSGWPIFVTAGVKNI